MCIEIDIFLIMNWIRKCSRNFAKNAKADNKRVQKHLKKDSY
jgi:hypothetical protein